MAETLSADVEILSLVRGVLSLLAETLSPDAGNLSLDAEALFTDVEALSLVGETLWLGVGELLPNAVTDSPGFVIGSKLCYNPFVGLRCACGIAPK